ncbi:MAG: TatD family hydrolase [Candidatus Paceibacterota bacterium]|jgi:TatD DNase family protein
MTIKYIDAHCHLQFEQYEHDKDEIVARMREEGIVGIVVGTDEESSKQATALAEKYEHLYAAVGIHPAHVWDIGCPTSDVGHPMSKFRELAHNPKVVAIGECGLDFFRGADDGAKRTQKEVFKKHIILAAKLDKPLMIHVRASKGTLDAYYDLIALLKEAKAVYPNLRGNIHFFAAGLPEAEALIALGFSISFTAVITFARDYDEVIRGVPLASILSETDAPYVAPASRRGERNDPLAVADVVRQIAEIRGEDPEIVRQTLLGNARGLFLAGNVISC